MPNFSDEIRKVLFGDPFGEVWPPKPNPPSPPLDGRTAALRLLKKYFSELVFYRTGPVDPVRGQRLEPIRFQVPERDIHVEWPDAVEDDRLPAIALLSEDRANYDSIGLTNYVDEASRDKYAPDTFLIWMYEYQETFLAELWCETKAQRRALIAGIEQAMSPLQQMAGIRFRMADYFDQLVCFELQNRELVDDDFAVKNRRRARLRILMRFNVVALVNAVDFQPVVEVQVDVDERTGESVQVSTEAED